MRTWLVFAQMVTIYIECCMNKSLHVAKHFRMTVLLQCIYVLYRNILIALLDNDYSIRVYQLFAILYRCLSIAINVFYISRRAVVSRGQGK